MQKTDFVGNGYSHECTDEREMAFGDVFPSHNDPESGFSLIELVMVIVVFSVAAVTLMSSFTNVGTAVALSEDLQVAKALVQECSEFIVVSRRDTINGYANISNSSCVVLPSNADYPRNVTVTPTTAAPCPTGAVCKLVTVSVSHNGNVLAETTTLLANY